MTPPDARARTPLRAQSLRSSWNRSFVALITLVVVCAVASFFGTRQLVDTFGGSARRVDREAEATATLRGNIVRYALLVGAPSGGPRDGELDKVDAAIRHEFAQVIAGEQAAPARTLFAASRSSWLSLAKSADDPDQALRAATTVTVVPRVLSLLDEAGSSSRAEARARLADSTRQYRVRRAVLAVLELLAIALAIRLARRLSTEVLQPVRRLRDSANTLAKGDYDQRVVVDRADELGDLAVSFNAMADAIAGSQQTLTRQATTDALTGLTNRAAFHGRLAAALTGAPRRAGSQAVLFVDLDDFKDVNDTLGHRAGDELLRVIARRLNDAVRPGDLVARVGGDEFAVLLDAITEPHDAVAVARRMLASLTEPVMVGTRTITMNASIGLALRGPASTLDSLMHEADVAMYAAKANGKNRVERYDAGLDDVAFARQAP